MRFPAHQLSNCRSTILTRHDMCVKPLDSPHAESVCMGWRKVLLKFPIKIKNTLAEYSHSFCLSKTFLHELQYIRNWLPGQKTIINYACFTDCIKTLSQLAYLLCGIPQSVECNFKLLADLYCSDSFDLEKYTLWLPVLVLPRVSILFASQSVSIVEILLFCCLM